MANPQSPDGQFLWYELMTTDMAGARAFYTDVLGWGARDVSTPGMPYTLFTVGKTSVSGLVQLPGGGPRPRWFGFVGVEDVDAAAARVEKLGGVVHVPPCDIPGVSRFAVFSDPQMAVLGLFKWLIPVEPVPDPPRAGRVGWHELFTPDPEQSFAFYSALFGWRKVDAGTTSLGTHLRFAAAGRTVGGMFVRPPSIQEPCWLYHFNVADIDAAAMKVRSGAGQVLVGPTLGPSGSLIVDCSDPQETLFSLAGKRSSTVGFFKPAATGDASIMRFGLRK
jgi:uncharacterized protein